MKIENGQFLQGFHQSLLLIKTSDAKRGQDLSGRGIKTLYVTKQTETVTAAETGRLSFVHPPSIDQWRPADPPRYRYR